MSKCSRNRNAYWPPAEQTNKAYPRLRTETVVNTLQTDAIECIEGPMKNGSKSKEGRSNGDETNVTSAGAKLHAKGNLFHGLKSAPKRPWVSKKNTTPSTKPKHPIENISTSYSMNYDDLSEITPAAGWDDGTASVVNLSMMGTLRVCPPCPWPTTASRQTFSMGHSGKEDCPLSHLSRPPITRSIHSLYA